MLLYKPHVHVLLTQQIIKHLHGTTGCDFTLNPAMAQLTTYFAT